MKLLTVLQDLKITRLGGTRAVPLDIRIISASNRDLKTLVAKGLFREDLYYRLNVLYLNLPPLRERLADVPELCEEFLSREMSRHNTNVRAVSPAVYPKLMEYTWPGNIRELHNVLLKAILLCDTPVLEPRHIELPSAGVPETARATEKRRTRRVSAERIREEINACGGNVSWAAENLGISRFTVYNKLKKAGR
jgi:transcriptional regulator with PAS, ATPase and Fis domain